MRAATVMSIDRPNEGLQQWRSPEPSYNPHARDVGSSGEPRPPQPAPYSEVWPIVGSGAIASGQQAPYPPLDLKDHLVPSIEPCSPESSQFPAQFHDRLRINPDHVDSYASRPRAEPGFQQAGSRFYHETAPARSYNEAVPTQGYHVREQPDFITLPPRYEATRPTAPAPHQAPLSVVVSSQTRYTQRGYTPIDLTGDAPSPSAYRNSPTVLQDRPALRSAARPIWIEDDNGNFRPENHPILTENRMPIRPAVIHPPHSAPDGRLVEVKQERNFAPIPTYVGDRTLRQVDNRAMPATHVRGYDGAHDDDVVEIVRVSNKFPRQHNDLLPADPQRYEPRSGAAYDPPRNIDGQHGLPTAPPRRIERVVARIEEPVYSQDGPYGGSRPVGHSGDFPVRQERVVGIEYVPTSRSGEIRTYADQPPVSRYEGERPIYVDQPGSRYGGDRPVYVDQSSGSRYEGERPIYTGQPPVSRYEGDRAVHWQGAPPPRIYEDGYPPQPDQPGEGIITIHRRA
jgi:hypothetical protein